MIAKKRKGTVTHQQIADKLGVSRQLVTHALNKTHRTRISLEMRRKVEQAARELHYQPRARTTHNIGYVLPLDSAYLEAEHVMSLKVESAARAAGYRLVVVGVRDEKEVASLSAAFNAKTVDGVISPRWFGGATRSALPADVPLVLTTDEYDIPEEVDVVCTDAFSTVQSMTQYLIDRGHRHIGLIVGAAGIKQHHDIISGTKKAFTMSGLPQRDIYLIRGSAKEVSSLMESHIQMPNAATAWIASSATYAMAILYGLYRQGLSAPEDVSVMSFTDSPSFEAMPVTLTATDAFGEQVAEMAVSRILRKVNALEETAVHQHLQAEIIERDSVRNLQDVAVT